MDLRSVLPTVPLLHKMSLIQNSQVIILRLWWGQLNSLCPPPLARFSISPSHFDLPTLSDLPRVQWWYPYFEVPLSFLPQDYTQLIIAVAALLHNVNSMSRPSLRKDLLSPEDLPKTEEKSLVVLVNRDGQKCERGASCTTAASSIIASWGCVKDMNSIQGWGEDDIGALIYRASQLRKREPPQLLKRRRISLHQRDRFHPLVRRLF